MAVGYVDGNINVFELTNNDIVCVFAGHKFSVTCLQYDEQGHRLVSGSKVYKITIQIIYLLTKRYKETLNLLLIIIMNENIR